MAITWNNIAAPNFGAANELFKQAQDNLLNVGATLTATAKGYQDAIRKRNTGLIQEYINSARTPEELQSDSFKQDYANLLKGLSNEYDPTFAAQAVGQQGDLLTKRANDALTLKSNEFTFGRNQKKANTEDAMAKLLTMPIEQREAAAAQLAKDGTFDPNVFQQYLQGEGIIRNQNDVNKLFNATYAATVEDANLKPIVTRHGMKIADRNAATAEKNANTQYLKTLADIQADKDKAEQLSKPGEKDKYIQTGFSKLNEVEKNVTSGFLKETLNIDPSITFSTWKEKAIDDYNDSDVEDIVEQIDKLPNISVKGDAYKIYLAEETLRKKRDRHLLGIHNVWSSDADREKTTYLLNQTVGEYEDRLSNVIRENKKPIYLDMITQYARENETDVYTAAQKIVGNDDALITSLGIDKPVVEPFVLDPKITLNPIQQTALNNLRLEAVRAGNLYESNPSEKNGAAFSDASQALRDYEAELGFVMPASNSNIVLPNETQRTEQRAFDRLYASGGNINITPEAVQEMLKAGLKVEPSNSVTTGASIITQKAEDNNLQAQEQRMQEAAKQRLLDASKQQVSTKQEAVKPVNQVSTKTDAITQKAEDNNLQAQEQKLQEAANLEGNNKPIIDAMLNPIRQLSTTEQMLKIQEQMRNTEDPILLAILKQQMLELLRQKPMEADRGLFSLYQ